MISAILLAGGRGTRLQSATPKQYLPLGGKPLACHSLEVLLAHPSIAQVIVVCAADYRAHFSGYPVDFAEPGERRQDSLFNGLHIAQHEAICVHDAARPFITEAQLTRLFEAGNETGAATLAVPMKATVKRSGSNALVIETLDREELWEIQTPQFLRKEVLTRGFAHADQHNLTVTDDVALAELIDHPVKLVLGSSKNIKVTTPEDLELCAHIS